MIDIASLSEGDVGRWVTYRKGPRVNRGRIKGWSHQVVYVVYWAGSGEHWDPIQRLLRINKQMPTRFNVVSYSSENIEMVYCHQAPLIFIYL